MYRLIRRRFFIWYLDKLGGIGLLKGFPMRGGSREAGGEV